MFASRDTEQSTAAAPRPRWRDSARRAVGLAVAFFTLEDDWEDSGPHAPAGDAVPHPHRQPLRPRRTARRPGAVAQRPSHCLSPVAAQVRAPSRRAGATAVPKR